MSLKISLEIGKKLGIAIALHNIASLLIKSKGDLGKSSFYLIKSIALSKEIGKKNISNSLDWLTSIKKNIGQPAFREMVIAAYNQLDEKSQKHVDIHEILGEPKKAEYKVGRNDPCPCGSGKKYKACHGKGT